MQNTDFTQYDIKPEGMINYLRYNGPHFNKKLCDFAISKMKRSVNGKLVKITPFTKEEVDAMLKQQNVVLENNELLDYLYVANMIKADFWGSSIISPDQLCKYIKDVIDDPDAYDGVVFNRWFADMSHKGIPVDWDEMV